MALHRPLSATELSIIRQALNGNRVLRARALEIVTSREQALAAEVTRHRAGQEPEERPEVVESPFRPVICDKCHMVVQFQAEVGTGNLRLVCECSEPRKG